MNVITLNTLLGNFWEEVVANRLTEMGISYDRSPDLGEGIISPDFVCRSEKTTFFVTCTSTRESFIKKRWRYINELFQVKGVLGDDMFVANLVFATNINLQPIEQVVLNELFDVSAFGDDFPDFDKLNIWVRSELEDGVDVVELSDSFMRKAGSKRFHTAVEKWLRTALLAKPQKFGSLWGVVGKYQGKRKFKPVNPKTATYWRRTCLRLLPLTLSERNEILMGLSGKPVKADVERLKKVGISTHKIVGGRLRVNDKELSATVAGGFTSAQINATIDALEFDNRSTQFPLNEVVDLPTVENAYAQYKPAFISESNLAAFALTEFKDPQSTRLKVWDYAVALADTSLLDVNKEYVRRWGSIAVANPINNVILKTDIGLSIARLVDISTVINRASTILWNRLPARITRSLFIEKVMEYRRRSLFLQPYLNPMQRHFEGVCQSILGMNVELTKSDCLLGDIGIRGRARRVEALYILKFKKKMWIFKVLSGYKGGYEHKADEMAARAWLLRFRIDASSGNAFMIPAKLVFVYEGEWDKKHLSILHASGWDEIVHLSDIEAFLNNISN